VTIPRRSVVLYLAAWILWVLAAACIGVSARGFLASTGLLWVAVGIAVAATAAAIAATVTALRQP
jgi:hypothetical protein